MTGPLTLTNGRHRIDEASLSSSQARIALALLAYARGRPVPRDELVEALWPAGPPGSWAAAVRTIVSKVRAFLSAVNLPGGELLTSSFGCYQLRLPAGATVDVDEAMASVDEAERALRHGDTLAARDAARRARAIAARPLLPGVEGSW
ncbi:MAG: helix-turn-helix domain-containing protein, partial [Chloroflexi bacterium]|nr:helix-turn-helix domain-containing protein [Chloroflexota bacterium]